MENNQESRGNWIAQPVPDGHAILDVYPLQRVMAAMVAHFLLVIERPFCPGWGVSSVFRTFHLQTVTPLPIQWHNSGTRAIRIRLFRSHQQGGPPQWFQLNSNCLFIFETMHNLNKIRPASLEKNAQLKESTEEQNRFELGGEDDGRPIIQCFWALLFVYPLLRPQKWFFILTMAGSNVACLCSPPRKPINSSRFLEELQLSLNF